METVKEDEDFEPDDMEKRGIPFGKVKTTKPTTTVATILCMALYPFAYDSSQGTLPLCAANHDQACCDRSGHDTTKTIATAVATTQLGKWNSLVVGRDNLKSELRGPFLIPTINPGAAPGTTPMWGPGVGCGGKHFDGSGSRLPLVADRAVEVGLLQLSASRVMHGENEVGG